MISLFSEKTFVSSVLFIIARGDKVHLPVIVNNFSLKWIDSYHHHPMFQNKIEGNIQLNCSAPLIHLDPPLLPFVCVKLLLYFKGIVFVSFLCSPPTTASHLLVRIFHGCANIRMQQYQSYQHEFIAWT